MSPTLTAPRQDADAAETPRDPVKAFIETRLRRREQPARIAAAVRAYFDIAIDPDQVVPYWKGDIALPTQTEHRPDKESVQLAADEPTEPALTRIAEVELPHPLYVVTEAPPATQTGRRQDAGCPEDADDAPATQTGRRQNGGGPADADDASATQTGRRQDAPSPDDADEASATQTGRRQDAKSLQVPADPLDDPRVTREERAVGLEALAALVKARLGIAPDPAEDADTARVEVAATQTGRRPNEKPKSVLSDEVKAFIVRGLARYETPTRVAASVQAQFGIAIDRRQVYAYDPAGSRPPAQRWIDLHAATRAKFVAAVAEIGVAQKIVRLRMLDRFANQMDE